MNRRSLRRLFAASGVVFLAVSVSAADLPLQRPAGRRGAVKRKAAATADEKQPVQVRIEGTDLGRMLKRDTANVAITTAPDGAIALDTAEGYRSVLVVQTTPEGKRIVSCIATERAADEIFNPPASDREPKPSKKVEKRQ